MLMKPSPLFQWDPVASLTPPQHSSVPKAHHTDPKPNQPSMPLREAQLYMTSSAVLDDERIQNSATRLLAGAFGVPSETLKPPDASVVFFLQAYVAEGQAFGPQKTPNPPGATGVFTGVRLRA